MFNVTVKTSPRPWSANEFGIWLMPYQFSSCATQPPSNGNIDRVQSRYTRAHSHTHGGACTAGPSHSFHHRHRGPKKKTETQHSFTQLRIDWILFLIHIGIFQSHLHNPWIPLKWIETGVIGTVQDRLKTQNEVSQAKEIIYMFFHPLKQISFFRV